MSNLTRKNPTSKPAKPHADFPLFPHATRRWAKKIRGKMHYFGPWDDPDGALEKWLAVRDDLLAGKQPRTAAEGVIVHELVNRFLASKRHQVDTREMAARTWQDYKTVCERVAMVFGTRRAVLDLGTDDFERLRKDFASTHKAPSSLKKDITVVKVLFKWAYDSGLIDRPVRFGPAFKTPSAKAMRQARQRKGERLFEAADLRRVIAAAGVPLKAMILLAVNCGFGNNDVATLPLSALQLKEGWLSYPRPKTAIERRCPLWPETVAAIEAALAERPSPRADDAEDKVFVTKRGLCWAKGQAIKQTESGEGEKINIVEKVGVDNPVAKETAKLLAKLGVRRAGLNFYALRHTFETIGGESRDQVAVNAIMGHAPAAGDMSSVYRERVSDGRLLDVVNHVRHWLLASGRGDEQTPDGGWTIENQSTT